MAGSASGGGGDANAIAVGTNGRPIVSGWFDDTVVFPTSTGSLTLTSDGEFDVFVGEWDPAQNVFTKVTQAGGSAQSNVRAASMLSDGSAVITGELQDGTMYFPTGRPAPDDSIALTPSNGAALFVAAWNPTSGNFLWAQEIDGNFDNPFQGFYAVQAQGLSSTSSHAPVVSGYFMGVAYFPTSSDDSIALVSPEVSGLLTQSAFVAQMNADDSYFAWAQQVQVAPDAASPFSAVVGDAVALAGGGRPVLTGSIVDATEFPTSADDSTVIIPQGGQSVFLAGMNADDSYFDWVQQVGGRTMDTNVASGSVGALTSGAPVVTGQFGTGDDTPVTVYFPTGRPAPDDSIALTGSQEGFVAATGAADDSYFDWALPITTLSVGGFVSPMSVSGGASGTAVVAGWFEGLLSLPTGSGNGAITLGTDDTSVSRAFVAGVKADGSGFEWALEAGGAVGAVNNALGVAVATVPSNASARAGWPMLAGWFSGTVAFGSSLSATATGNTQFGQRNPFVAAIEVDATPPTPPAPPPVYPASAPTGATAVAGDASAKVSWSAPASSGSFPVTSYQATASPGGESCLATAPALTCEVMGLRNGTTYTFRVKALNGAGWSPESEPSNAVTPTAVNPPADKTITITGSRSGNRIVVTGSSTGIDPGSILKPWVRFPGQTSYSEGTASITVREKGAFTWERRTGKKAYVYIQTNDGKVKSNTVTIAAR